MKLRILLLTTLVNVLISANGYAYDATGTWNYTESNLQHNCPAPYILESGEINILQDGSTFLIVSDAYSTQGTVSGNTYNFSDKWSDVYDFTLVSISSQSSITLTSLTAGSGLTSFTASWTEGGGGFCNGSFTTTVSRQTPVMMLQADGITIYQIFITIVVLVQAQLQDILMSYKQATGLQLETITGMSTRVL